MVQVTDIPFKLQKRHDSIPYAKIFIYCTWLSILSFKYYIEGFFILQASYRNVQSLMLTYCQFIIKMWCGQRADSEPGCVAYDGGVSVVVVGVCHS